MTRRFAWTAAAALLVVACAADLSRGADDEHARKADATIAKGIAYLRAAQGEDGSWSPQFGPAVTALVLNAMLDQPDIGPTDPAAARGLKYLLGKAKPDGGIHSGILENYNTSICLSALSRVSDQPGVAPVIKNAQDYLRNLQWGGQKLKDGTVVNEANPFYGGAGYSAGGGRPDLSNTQLMLQALYDSGVDCHDAAFQRAMVFVSRVQAMPDNARLAGKLEPDGGFVYALPGDKTRPAGQATTRPAEKPDEGKAGRPVSSLRTYGSMTYAGLMSYTYAKLDRSDPRVRAAFAWVCRNYTVDQNPGMPADMKDQGLYYYYLTFARALKAWGSPKITAADGAAHDWANDLIDKLSALQHGDGSWVNKASDRWGESDPLLVTAYSLNALNAARR